SGWFDELAWAGIWLYLATKDVKYLDKAEFYYDSLGTELGTQHRKFKWTHCWDDKTYGCYVYLARLTGKEKYRIDTERWLDFWTCGFESFKIKYTPGGLAWLDRWGVLRYSANTSLFALIYSDYLKGVNGDKEKIKRYSDFGYSQVNYILGANPSNRSFVCGVGNNPPVNPHHRSAHGSEKFMITEPKNNRFPLDGALVGGPDQNDKYIDDRNNYEMNEVACDYNAAFTSVLARIIRGEKVASINKFKIEEKLKKQTEVSAHIVNSLYPKIHCTLKLRKSERINITLFNISGKRIECVADSKFTPGTHSINYNMKNRPCGAYYIVIKTEKTHSSKFITLL
ncbi:MAG: glycoside hydrolase family 9 protein, partial [Chitinispirillia bacterium]